MIEVKMNSMDGVVLMTAGKKVEENIKVIPAASFITPEYNGEYELLVPTVSGVWVFNEEEALKYDNIARVQVTATVVGGTTSYIEVSEDDGYIGTEFCRLYVFDIAEQPIDFGTTVQEVSEEFYAWLTANAVKQ